MQTQSLVKPHCKAIYKEEVKLTILFAGTSAIVSRLLSLAPEIQLALFDQLDAVSSTCLGLTCKYFYNLHVAQHGLKVPLFRRSDHESAIPPYSALFQRNGPLVLNWIKRELEFTDPSRIKAFVMDRVYLCGCLREWMGPQYLYSLKTRRYMKRDSYDEYPEGQTNTMELSDLEGVIEWIPLGADRLISRPFMSNGLAPFPG